MDRFTLETSRPGFYAGGDVITGASNVSNAMGGGKQAARNIDKRLMGESQWERLFPEFEYSRLAPGEPSLSRRHTAQGCLRARVFVRRRKWLPASAPKKRWRSVAAASAATCTLPWEGNNKSWSGKE